MDVSPDAYARADYRPPAGIRWNGWWFLAAIAPAAVLEFSLGTLRPHLDPGTGRLLSPVLSVLTYGWALLTLAVASRRRGLGTLRADFGWEAHPIDLFWGIVALVAVFAITVATGRFVESLGPVVSNMPPLTGDRVSDVIRLFFVPTLVAAPIEELLFRGLLMRWIRDWLIRRGPRPRRDGEPSRLPLHASVLISAVAFAAPHLSQVAGTASLVELAIQTLSLGIVNGYLASRTGRLGGAVVAHGLHNAIAGVLALAP